MKLIRMMVQFFLQRDFTYKMKPSGKKCKLQKKNCQDTRRQTGLSVGCIFFSKPSRYQIKCLSEARSSFGGLRNDWKTSSGDCGLWFSISQLCGGLPRIGLHALEILPSAHNVWQRMHAAHTHCTKAPSSCHLICFWSIAGKLNFKIN